MALRQGFTRYAISLQYHGSSFLGFAWQRHQENCILPDGTDLRGYRTVEGRLREALTDLLRKQNAFDSDNDDDHDPAFENIQVSSRTDRGVHALHNTLHVDIRNRDKNNRIWSTEAVHRGLNYHLSRQLLGRSADDNDNSNNNNNKNNIRPFKASRHHLPRGAQGFPRWSPMNEIKILRVREAPRFMINPYAAAVEEANEQDLPLPSQTMDWNARFSATERTYLYRILHAPARGYDDERDWAAPFEWDRAWQLQYKRQPLDVAAMRQAATYMQGHNVDVSSFRNKGCQRKSPIVDIFDVHVITQPYGPALGNYGAGAGSGGDERYLSGLAHLIDDPSETVFLTTILVRGNAFVYRQVRNMVGCLVEVGKGKLRASAVPELMARRDRHLLPITMAPAHGLFLARVRHGDFDV